MIGDRPTHWLPIVMNAWDCEALDGTPVKIVDPVKQAVRIPTCDRCKHWNPYRASATDEWGCCTKWGERNCTKSEYCSRFERAL